MFSRLPLGLGLVCVTTMALSSVGSASPAASKQRIAIVERINFAGSGTFELIPLSSGPLKRDTGSVSGTGSEKLSGTGYA